MRVEDLDAPRVVRGAADDILRKLEALGLEWDGEVVYQSRRGDRYLSALEHLRGEGLVFDCGCSRREIFASAPHGGEQSPLYPGTCRRGLPSGRRPRAQRIRVPEAVVHFIDGLFGPVGECLATAVGDFVLRRADGLFAYQLAVVVDDAEMGVNQVVRGKDLLSSTGRQVFLNACLGYPVPHYIHLPLALAPDGDKISKRHGAAAAGACDGRRGDLLWRVLQFLGQEPPEGLRDWRPETSSPGGRPILRSVGYRGNRRRPRGLSLSGRPAGKRAGSGRLAGSSPRSRKCTRRCRRNPG